MFQRGIRATAGVECRKGKDAIHEIPMAYKDIDAFVAVHRDPVEVVHTSSKWSLHRGSQGVAGYEHDRLGSASTPFAKPRV